MVGLTVGDRVRHCRKLKRWSQERLAKEAQVTQATISHVEISTETMNNLQIEGRVVWKGGLL